MNCISDKIVDDILIQKGWTLHKNFDEISTGSFGNEIVLYTSQNELVEEKFFNLLIFLQVVVVWESLNGDYQFAIDNTKLASLESNLRYYGNADSSSLTHKYGRWVQNPYIKTILGSSEKTATHTLFGACQADAIIFINTLQRKLAYASCYLEGHYYLLKRNRI